MYLFGALCKNPQIGLYCKPFHLYIRLIMYEDEKHEIDELQS